MRIGALVGRDWFGVVWLGADGLSGGVLSAAKGPILPVVPMGLLGPLRGCRHG